MRGASPGTLWRMDVTTMDKTDLFKRDSAGRTVLFHAAETGDMDEVQRMIFSLAGTGLCCQRLSLLEIRDASGFTALDMAERNGHKAIADLLRGEQMRMEFFE